MMERNKMYILIAIVVIAGLVALFALSFLPAGEQNVTGAAWLGGDKYDCYFPGTGETQVGGCGSDPQSDLAESCRNSGGSCHINRAV